MARDSERLATIRSIDDRLDTLAIHPSQKKSEGKFVFTSVNNRDYLGEFVELNKYFILSVTLPDGKEVGRIVPHSKWNGTIVHTLRGKEVPIAIYERAPSGCFTIRPVDKSCRPVHSIPDEPEFPITYLVEYLG